MEGFDFDSTSPLTVADIVVGGEKKHVVMQAPKNGVMYVIEVATGKVVSADPFVPSINWATGFDEKNNWAPILNPDADYGKTGKGFYVVPGRAHAWSSQSYNPNTGLIYVPASYGVGSYVAEKGSQHPGQPAGGCEPVRSSRTRRYAAGPEGHGLLPAGLGSGEAQGGVDTAPGQRQRRHADHGRQPGVPGHSRAEALGHSAPTRAS